MTLHIGIAACSAEGAALAYRTICAEAAGTMGQHAHPEITMHTPSLADYVACLEAGDMRGVAALMLRSAEVLAGAGADFAICPDNTIHQALPLMRERSPLPWLHIAEVVADAAAARGFRRLGLLGTRWLVESDVYPEALGARGIECVRPGVRDRSDCDRAIMQELVPGRIGPDSAVPFLAAIGRLAQEGCEAAILGCTEIPLVVGAENSALPVLDSTRLLARAAIARAVG